MNKKADKSGINNNILIAVIVVMSIVIAVMGFFLGKMSGGDNTQTTVVTTDNSTTTSPETTQEIQDLTLTIITDKRDTDTPVQGLIDELKKIPSIQNSTIVEKDFSDDGVEEYFKSTGLKTLPAFIFSTKSFDVSADETKTDQYGQMIPKINAYLQELGNGEYYLDVGATYDPFIERSDRGLKQMSQVDFDSIISSSYVDGDIDADIVWIEYSDLECPYCARFHKAETQSTVIDGFDGEIASVFNHYPLSFHANAMDAAEILECLGEQKGSDAFYSLMRTSFANVDESLDTSYTSSKDYLVAEAVKLGADKASLEACVAENRYEVKITNQMNNGMDLFGITGTPGNVLINTKTLEYEVISGAYPAESFEAVLENLK